MGADSSRRHAASDIGSQCIADSLSYVDTDAGAHMVTDSSRGHAAPNLSSYLGTDEYADESNLGPNMGSNGTRCHTASDIGAHCIADGVSYLGPDPHTNQSHGISHAIADLGAHEYTDES